ncbi:uncharacterized protein LOC108047098 [Drosophila rhopaloa]|uniref:TATA box-binding protein-like 1 n=2 Tax=Drosophila rhopaloa TaxID=1041015 RepID=A0ABM5HMS5_DRORH|nr:uncharacterized protein LOC108047098 [Drosophila rhopaloa]XP_044317238.1 uncharacterized protein LOC108047098 [Drosophila rhopaloa]XP_044317239.1 uncharacterized protein LOC108047098 [Drosophila rhopaloa]XP_044317240.1 uncharacterized protein LOC108047098 [Drosophila rhopaloa]
MVKIREDEARIPTMGSFSSNTKNVQKALLLKEVNQEPSLEKEAGAEAQENVAEPTPGKQDPGGSGTEPDKENQSPNPKRSASKDFESKIKYSEPEKEQGKGYYVLHPNQHDNIRQKSLLKSDQESGSAAKQSTSEDSDRGSSSSDSEGKEGNGNKTVSRSNQQDGNIRQGLSLKRTRVKGSLANQSSSEDSNRKSSYSQSEEEGGYNIRQGSLKKKRARRSALSSSEDSNRESSKSESEEEGGNENCNAGTVAEPSSSDLEKGEQDDNIRPEDSDCKAPSSDSEKEAENGNITVSRPNQQDENIRQGSLLKRKRVANESPSKDSNRETSNSESKEGDTIRLGPFLKRKRVRKSVPKQSLSKDSNRESSNSESEEEGGNENRTSSENSPASGSVAQRSTLVVSGRGLTSSESEEGETRNLYVLRRYYQDEQSTFEDLGSYPGSDEELSNEDWTASNQESYYIRRVAQLPTFVDSDRELSSSGTEEEEIQNLNVSQSNQEDEVKESVAEKTSSEDSDVESLYPGSEEEDDSIRVRGSLAENSDIESLASDTEEEDDTTLQRTILQRDGTKESETECKDSTSEDEQQLQDSSSLGPNASDLDPLDIHQLQDLLNSSFDESAEVTSDQEDDNKSKEEVSETDQEDTESEGDRRRDTDISSDSAPEDFREYFNFEEPHEEEREYPEGGEGYEGQGSASDEDGQEQGLSSPGKNSNDSYGSDNQQLQPLVNSNSGPNFDESDSEEEEEIAGHRKVSTPDQEDDTKSEEASVKAQESETEQEDTESEDSEEEQCDTSGDRRQDTDTNSDSDPENFREDFNCEESHENGEGYESQEPDSDENGQEQDSSSSGPNSNNSDRLDDNKSKVEVSESEEEDTESEDSEEEQGDTSGNSRRDTDTNSDSDSDPGDNRQSFNSEKSREKEHQYPKGGKGYKSQGQTFGENGKAGNRASYERVCSFTTPPKLNQALLEDHSRVKIEDIDRNLDSFIQIKRKRNPNWEKETIIKTRRVDKIFRELLKVTTVEGDTLSDFSAYGSEKSLEQVTYSLEKANKIFQLLKREQIQVTNWIERELNDLEFDIKLWLQRQEIQIKLTQQEYPNTLLQRQCGLMQNEMVSIPVANLNGGLKAASSGSGVGVVAAGGVVSSAVLANAPRVYLTPSSTFMANRQASAGVASTGKISGSIVGGSSGTSAATGTVRYFSQFSKVQTAGGPSLQRKLANGDTIVLANGNKSLFFTSSDKGAVSSIATNGNCSLQAKTELLEEEDMQPGTVIEEEEDEEDSSLTAKPLGGSSGPQDQPLALTTAANEGNASEDEPELDIVINNVVCSFSVGCHLKLREIALQGSNVEYRRENGMVTMKLRHPYTTASIWSSGRITCTGATSEAMAKVAARRYARCLGKLGFPTRFLNFRIVNVLGTCSMPWAIKIVNFSERHRENASYEPELHPGVTYKMRDPDPKATLKIFSTGSVTVTAASVSHVESAIQHIYPLVFEFRKQRSPEELQHLRQKQRQQSGVDPNELESQVVSQNKVAAQDNIFVNTTAAHTKPPGDNTPATSGIMSSTIDSMQRLKQMESYNQMAQRTTEERRHIPFQGDKVGSASTSAAAAAAASSGDNICANARRRATECWATKLQNKRPRYNDPGTPGAAPSSSSAAASSASASASSNVFSPSLGSQASFLRNPLKTAALANARMRGAKVPTSMVLKPGTRIGPTSGFLHQQHLQHQQQQQQQQKMRQTSFSPSDFQVDDLIEEEESNEMDLQY